MNDLDITSMQIKIEALETEKEIMTDTLTWIKANCATHSAIEVYRLAKDTLEKVS